MGRKSLDTSDTIFALASGALPSSVAILRVSGPNAFSIARHLFQKPTGTFEEKRDWHYGAFQDLEGNAFDDGILLVFPADRSPVGENTVEFQCHGAQAVVERFRELFLSLGARPAEPGEFSYRSLVNGRLGADSAEHLADLFRARSAKDLRRLFGRRDESLRRDIEGLRGDLIQALAILDTAVDFVEEYASVLTLASQPVARAIQGCSAISQRFESFGSAERLGRIVLVGAPNAGKSSLFNALLGRYRAIVSPSPGTTRDLVEDTIRLGGRDWTLVDTAGLHETVDAVEAEGVSMAREVAEQASFRVWVVDGSAALFPDSWLDLSAQIPAPRLVVWNKRDLASWREPSPELGLQGWIGTSVGEGSSISAIAERLTSELAQRALDALPTTLPTACQARRLRSVGEALTGALAELSKGVRPPELLSEDVRQSLMLLEEVLGPVSVDDVLDRVFSEFCLGK